MTGRETQEARIAAREKLARIAEGDMDYALYPDEAAALAAELEAVTARETRANEALTAARRERDEVYAVNAAAANDRARALEATIEEIVALCEPDRIPLPLLNSRILRVIRTASAAGASDE